LLQAYCGVVFFMSCMYVVPIIPHQYSKAGYNLQNTVSGASGWKLWAFSILYKQFTLSDIPTPHL
jgi:hypothetical protein